MRNVLWLPRLDHVTLRWLRDTRYNTPQNMEANPANPANPPYKVGMFPLELTIAFCTSYFTVL